MTLPPGEFEKFEAGTAIDNLMGIERSRKLEHVADRESRWVREEKAVCRGIGWREGKVLRKRSDGRAEFIKFSDPQNPPPKKRIVKIIWCFVLKKYLQVWALEHCKPLCPTFNDPNLPQFCWPGQVRVSKIYESRPATPETPTGGLAIAGLEKKINANAMPSPNVDRNPLRRPHRPPPLLTRIRPAPTISLSDRHNRENTFGLEKCCQSISWGWYQNAENATLWGKTHISNNVYDL